MVFEHHLAIDLLLGEHFTIHCPKIKYRQAEFDRGHLCQLFAVYIKCVDEVADQ